MSDKPLFLRLKLHHILPWVLVFVLWYYFRHQDYRTSRVALAVTALKVGDLALMIYLANYLLIPRLLYKKKYGWFALTFIAMIVTSSLTKMYIIGQITHQPYLYTITGTNFKARMYDNVIPHFFLVIAGAAFK